MKDAKKVLPFRQAISSLALGGNLHNELVDMERRVAIYKAVMTKNQVLCHVGDYIAYVGEEDEEVFKFVAYIGCQGCILKLFL